MSSLIGTRLLQYGLVGVAGMAVDFSATWIGKEKIRLNKYLANSIGFSLAVINNFLLNRYWTFHDTAHPFAPQLIRFLLVSLSALGINHLLLYLLVNKAHKNFYLLKLVVIGLVFFYNYLLNFLFTFN
ncbi:GtrA family protein [Ferruginibacter paludis]|uniref:GtrA family protein n=1 Tax=Ferruginibacter paludis TaxID=1310417 RepID=UPI0025B61284|nr:GtrA family protein [Ferruginibacter paludis]MDN3656718.1 GtrA family protein [Ferruginibacter paludis]